MKKISSLILFLVSLFSFAQAPVPGGQSLRTPIDMYQIILVIAAVLLMVGAIAYKKLSVKKA